MTMILRGTPATIEMLNFQAGDLVDFDGTPTLSVVDGAGAAVATEAVTSPSTGIYQTIVPARSTLTMLTATWSGTIGGRAVTHIVGYEVVGATLADEALVRAFGAKAGGTGPLSSTTDYTDAMIDDSRERQLGRMEDWTERAWIPRYCRVEAAGSGDRWLWLGAGEPRLADGTPLHRPGRLSDVHRIISATVDGVTVPTSSLIIDSTVGAVARTDTVWAAATDSNPRNVTIEYEYGLSAATAGSDRILMALIVDDLVPSLVSDRAMSLTTEMGVERYVTAGYGGNVTSLPGVNAWVQQQSRHLPVG